MITKHPKNARRPKSAPGRSQFLKQLALAQKVGALNSQLPTPFGRHPRNLRSIRCGPDFLLCAGRCSSSPSPWPHGPLPGTLASTLSGTLSQTPSSLWSSFLGTLGTLARLNYPRRVKGLSFAKEDLPSAIQPAIRSLLLTMSRINTPMGAWG